MVVEVWDEQGPRCYVDLAHPLPPLLQLPVKQRGVVFAPAGIPETTTTTVYPILTETFQLFAIHDHELRSLTPVYVKLNDAGVPCLA